MKFEIKLSFLGTKESKAAGEGDPFSIIKMTGDLDTVKTYIKLAIGKNFNWGAITRLDELVAGDVNRWLIQKDRTTGELFLAVLSFFDVDPEINLNAMQDAMTPDQRNVALNTVLGGGYL